jgi:hypothetical protein
VSAVGAGWQQLIDELQEELHSLDPTVRLSEAKVDSHGLLRLRARFSSDSDAAGKALLRKYEERGLTTCELCGGSGRVYAGAVVIVRCEGCSEG